MRYWIKVVIATVATFFFVKVGFNTFLWFSLVRVHGRSIGTGWWRTFKL